MGTKMNVNLCVEVFVFLYVVVEFFIEGLCIQGPTCIIFVTKAPNAHWRCSLFRSRHDCEFACKSVCVIVRGFRIFIEGLCDQGPTYIIFVIGGPKSLPWVMLCGYVWDGYCMYLGISWISWE